ncbi:MAG: GxxExxY protein [Bacteroidia bacterium]|nr:GxxExxY protein [Bacteroidia bacterium]
MPLSVENNLAHKTIGLAIEIHKSLGPGLDHNIYADCLRMELQNNSVAFREKDCHAAQYKNLEFNNALCCDFLLEETVAVIIDKSDSLQEFRVQNMIKFLRQKNLKLGLVINFNTSLLKNGIRRVTNQKMLEGYNLNADGTLNS